MYEHKKERSFYNYSSPSLHKFEHGVAVFHNTRATALEPSQRVESFAEFNLLVKTKGISNYVLSSTGITNSPSVKPVPQSQS